MIRKLLRVTKHNFNCSDVWDDFASPIFCAVADTYFRGDCRAAIKFARCESSADGANQSGYF